MKVDKLLKEKRIKEHVFLPSNRRIVTIISNDEYWVDHDLKICSCKGYYYNYSKQGKICNHLEALIAATRDNIDTIVFNDEEYPSFLSALICDISRYTTIESY